MAIKSFETGPELVDLPVPPVQRGLRLEDVPQAIADFSKGTLGKLAVRVRD